MRQGSHALVFKNSNLRCLLFKQPCDRFLRNVPLFFKAALQFQTRPFSEQQTITASVKMLGAVLPSGRGRKAMPGTLRARCAGCIRQEQQPRPITWLTSGNVLMCCIRPRPTHLPIILHLLHKQAFCRAVSLYKLYTMKLSLWHHALRSSSVARYKTATSFHSFLMSSSSAPTFVEYTSPTSPSFSASTSTSTEHPPPS